MFKVWLQNILCVLVLVWDHAAVERSENDLETSVRSIKFDQENPNTPGSKAFQRYEKCKQSKTVGEAMGAGANWQDITGDFERCLLVVINVDMPSEGGPGSSVKRGAPDGTPDREASARAKAPLKEVVLRSVLNDWKLKRAEWKCPVPPLRHCIR